jgi:hypothetical protein
VLGLALEWPFRVASSPRSDGKAYIIKPNISAIQSNAYAKLSGLPADSFSISKLQCTSNSLVAKQ